MFFTKDRTEYIDAVYRIETLKADLIKTKNSLNSTFSSINTTEANLTSLYQIQSNLRSDIKIVSLSEYKKVLHTIANEINQLVLYKRSVPYYERQIKSIEEDLDKWNALLPSLRFKLLEFKKRG